MSSYQAITRTIIMLGTIAVGIMAWRVYGPPAEKLAPIINRSVEVANELLGRTGTGKPSEHLPAPELSVAKESPPAIFRPGNPPLRVDTEVEPAGHSEPFVPGPLPSRSLANSNRAQIDDLLAQLKSMGAVDTILQPWGSSGQTYRFQCRVASSEDPAIDRHFDAIDSDPRTAVKRVLESVRQHLER